MIRRTAFVALLLLLNSFGLASSKPVPGKSSTIVDQGSFSIFQNGQQIATEKFIVQQYADKSVTSSELLMDAGQPSSNLDQSGELILLPNGSVSRYESKQLSPPYNSAIIEPNNEFLVMHVVTDGKASEQPFFLTPQAFILDDYFFSTREVLLWRYLASFCKPRAGGEGCDLVRGRFPIIIPRRRTSSEVFIEFKGYDDLPLNGRPQHLRHFIMQTDGADWHLWMDQNYKLLRISIPDSNTEILRQEK
jgi:hypothetical protein